MEEEAVATRRRSRRRIAATPRNLALDARRKRNFERAFEKWEKKAKAAMKKRSWGTLRILLKRIRPMVFVPLYGAGLYFVGKRPRGGDR
jgi:hypothetical protein